MKSTTKLDARQVADLCRTIVEVSAGTPRARRSLTIKEQVTITLTYLRTNVTQEFLAEQHHTSQATVSRVIADLTTVIAKLLAWFVPDVEERSRGTTLLVDGSLLPCWSWASTPTLYSGKHHTTGHNILKLAINPRSAQHQIVQLKGETSAVQMHVEQPAIYLRVGDDSGIRPGGTPLVVDTHGSGASGAGGVKKDSSGGSQDSGYVMVRADVRTDARVVASFNIGMLGGMKTQEDVIETTSELLPGGHWMKVTPKKPLDFGEYALIEVISNKEINMGVWDFGVHPVAPENRDVMKPQPKRPITLERRH